jgi:hypothetical protein
MLLYGPCLRCLVYAPFFQPANTIWGAFHQRFWGLLFAVSARDALRDARRASPNIEIHRPTPPKDVLDPGPPMEGFEGRFQSRAEQAPLQLSQA